MLLVSCGNDPDPVTSDAYLALETESSQLEAELEDLRDAVGDLDEELQKVTSERDRLQGQIDAVNVTAVEAADAAALLEDDRDRIVEFVAYLNSPLRGAPSAADWLNRRAAAMWPQGWWTPERYVECIWGEDFGRDVARLVDALQGDLDRGLLTLEETVDRNSIVEDKIWPTTYEQTANEGAAHDALPEAARHYVANATYDTETVSVHFSVLADGNVVQYPACSQPVTG
ncbi:MAG: hypothetical protein RIB98_00365 [Acidimicrobiales bacterium]